MTGQELREWRAAHDYDQARLARALQVSVWTISQWETERRKVPAYLWRALEHLDCTTRRPPPSERE